MARKAFAIEYAQEAVQDIRLLQAHDRKKVVDGIETHLIRDPVRVSRSRIKEMTQPFWSQYRLRVDEFRVYYDVGLEKRTVSILRILEKGKKETIKEPNHETR